MKNNRFKLAIFDCDGVLFDSREANRHYYNAVLAHVGLPAMTEEQLSFCHMHTAADSIKYLLDSESEQTRLAAVDFIKELDYADYLKFMVMEPGVQETVNKIHSFMPTAISTNRSTTMPLLVSMYGLDQLFDKIVCALDVKNPKPHPEGVFNILAYFNIRPEESVYVGDTLVDQQVSENSSVPFIAYKNANLDAMFHVEHFSQIGDILAAE